MSYSPSIARPSPKSILWYVPPVRLTSSTNVVSVSIEQLLRSAINHSPAHHRQRRPNALDLGRRYGQVITVEHDQVGLFADLERAERLFLKEQKCVRTRMRD